MRAKERGGEGGEEKMCVRLGGADGENNLVVFHPPPEGSDTPRRRGRKEEGNAGKGWE